MNIIDNIQIDNLWGNGSVIKFRCDRKFNFLIGENGTGKTTVINLIAAALTGDFERLDKTEFDRIMIRLKPISGSKKPSIEVKKTKKQDNIPFYDISYEFRHSQKENPIKFDFDAIEQERFFRGSPPRVLRERMFRDNYIDIRKQLDSFVNVSWLSIHRHNEEVRPGEDRRNVPAIDQKLVSLNNSLVRYFSALARKYSDNIIDFQKKTLLSVLTPEKSEALIAFTSSIDVENEKNALAGIFEVLGVEEKHYAQKIRSHFDKFNQAVKAREQNTALNVDQFATIYNTWRSHSLVQDYEELQQKKADIFKSRDNFISVINELLGGRKKMSLSDRNELSFETKNNKPIPIEELSSGEKQLLIILGEALLQQEKAVVYIADEPELSLHISWQETLTSSISSLNPNAQIIFATHSPDIVNSHSDKIINMEDVIK